MLRIALSYGAALAALALLVAWLDWHQAVRPWPGPAYGLAVALIFTALGAWLALRLVPRPRGAFALNTRALAALAISPREHEVLALLAEGLPNKAIARRLAISPNTVKTHLASLFAKLEASTRTEAIAKARALNLLP